MSRPVNEDSIYIIKIGGSAITNKGRTPSIREDLLDGIVENVSRIKDEKVIVHGAGSYGHPIVKKHGLQSGFKVKRQLNAFMETKLQLAELNNLVLQSFKSHGIPSLTFVPSSFLLAKDGRIVEANLTPLRRILRLGITPILHGDLVADLHRGFSVVSGDQLVSYLAKRMPVKLAIFGCDVDGVYERDPKKHKDAKIVKEITPSTFEEALSLAETTGSPDVTEGMAGKIKEAVHLAEFGIKSAIINITNPKNIIRLVNGEAFPHTKFLPDRV